MRNCEALQIHIFCAAPPAEAITAPSSTENFAAAHEASVDTDTKLLSLPGILSWQTKGEEWAVLHVRSRL